MAAHFIDNFTAKKVPGGKVAIYGQERNGEEDIQRIVDAYDKYENIDRFAHVASPDEIKENEYNLNIPRYVDTFEEEKPVDMDAVKENIANIKLELAEVEVKMQKQLDELGL
ncbi:MAG: N-6 DNA methylase [Candidatus Methanoperedens sp.]|nr:N-6 DNA methylase [Candidatus Methanoperedens sp.]